MSTEFSILSATLLFLFVIDPFGNIPILLSVMKGVPQKRQYQIVVRDGLIGLIILVCFLFFGAEFLALLHLETESISIAGGRGVVCDCFEDDFSFALHQGSWSRNGALYCAHFHSNAGGPFHFGDIIGDG